VYPPPFEYHRPEQLAEATALLADLGPDAAVLAGGMSLIPRLKARTARPAHVVDIGRLAELAGARRQDGVLAIGALTRHADLAGSADVAGPVPMLAEAARQIGDQQVRNWGTIGGSVGEVYPGADLPATLIALSARLRCHGAEGERTLTAEEQFAGGDTVATGPGELVTAIEVDVPPPRSGGAHVRLERRLGLAVVACSAMVTLDEQGRYATARAAVSAVRAAPVPALSGAELAGQTPGPDLHREAAAGALADVDGLSDLRGSAAYRRRTAGVMIARALDLAAGRAAQNQGDRT
jgi:carbon-monoxide dehydrogenase medium subunit